VYACADCGEEVTAPDATSCGECGGVIERVDPLLVSTIDLLEAVLHSGEGTER
jgi:hypothetical protein